MWVRSRGLRAQFDTEKNRRGGTSNTWDLGDTFIEMDTGIPRVNTIRRAGYSLLVAGLVFVWLALPILSRLFGPVVYLPAYAFAALIAGSLAWSVLGWLSSSQRDVQFENTDITEESLENADSPSVDVDTELEELKNDR